MSKKAEHRLKHYLKSYRNNQTQVSLCWGVFLLGVLTTWTTDIRKERDKLMNRDKGSYQLPHIYDCLLSVTATPGGQSFQKKQQRLPKCQQ